MSTEEKQVQWTCQILPGEAPFTVGSKQKLDCTPAGTGAPQLGGEVQIVFPKTVETNKEGKVEQKDSPFDYSLVVLKTDKAASDKIEATVTGYKAGEFTNVTFRITDGINSVPVSPMNYKLESVIPPNTQAQPFPSFGPFALSIPLWFWISIAIVVASVVGTSIYFWRRHLRRKRDFLEMQQHLTAMTPFNQFSKDVRHLRKLQVPDEVLTETEKAFRFYLLRQFLMPAHVWKDGQILRELKRKNKNTFEYYGTELKRILREFDRFKGKKQELQPKDAEQVLVMSQKWAEKASFGGGDKKAVKR